jgi:hypothetical protein
MHCVLLVQFPKHIYPSEGYNDVKSDFGVIIHEIEK